MEVALPVDIEAVVRAKVAAGEYPSVTALVEEALFLLVQRDWQAVRHELGDRAAFLFDGGDLVNAEGADR